MRGATPVTAAGVSVDQDALVAAGGGLKLMGYACRESAGTPAVAAFDIVEGATGDGGTLIVPVELAADSSKSEWFGPDGIEVPAGISINVVAGTVDVVVYTVQE